MVKPSRRNQLIGQERKIAPASFREARPPAGSMEKKNWISFISSWEDHATLLTIIATTVVTLSIFVALIIARFVSPMEHMSMIRNYYIAAEEVQWNYLPKGVDGVTGSNLNTTFYVQSTSNRIGTIYSKCLYREYTDDKFSKLKPRKDEWAHLGLLGPVLRAQVGEMMRVTFLNRCSFPASIHSHALLYSSIGDMNVMSGEHPSRRSMDSNNSTGSGAATTVQPNDTFIYEWFVPERSGPAIKDGSSVVWMYHSHVDQVADMNTGLIGPLIITREGWSKSSKDPMPRDVDREFIIMFTIMDENQSHFLNASIINAIKPATTPRETLMMDEEFLKSNQKNSINGALFSNLDGIVMKENEAVRWYIFAIGDETDLHGVHWHGQTVINEGLRYVVLIITVLIFPFFG